MNQPRAFSLVETLVVVSVIALCSGFALQSLSDSIATAKARGQRLSLVRAVKVERLRANERLAPLAVRAAGEDLSFHRAVINYDKKGEATGCTVGAQVSHRAFSALDLSMVNGTALCLDENGRPVDPTVAIAVDVDEDSNGVIDPGEEGTLAFSTSGLAEATGTLIGPMVGASDTVNGPQGNVSKKHIKKLDDKQKGKKGDD